MGSDGVVYVLTNPSFRDGIVKIGMTTRTAEDRAWEIYVGATGVPEPFKIAFAERCSSCALGESLVHEKLKNRRVNERREFFSVPLEEAISTVRAEVARVNAASPTKPDPTLSNRVKIVQTVLDAPAKSLEAVRGPEIRSADIEGADSVGSPASSAEIFEISPPAVSYPKLPRSIPWLAVFLVPCGVFWSWLAYLQLSNGVNFFGLFCGVTAAGIFAAVIEDCR